MHWDFDWEKLKDLQKVKPMRMVIDLVILKEILMETLMDLHLVKQMH